MTQVLRISAIGVFVMLVTYFEFVFEFPIKDYYFITLPEPRLFAQFNGPFSRSSALWLLIHHLVSIVLLCCAALKALGSNGLKVTTRIAHILFGLVLLPNCTTFMDWPPTHAISLNLGVYTLLSMLLYFECSQAYFVVLTSPIWANFPRFFEWVNQGQHILWLVAFGFPVVYIVANYGRTYTLPDDKKRP